MSNWRHTTAAIARAKKADPAADVTELKRELKTELLADYIRKRVDAAPPLTLEQRERLASLLRGSAA